MKTRRFLISLWIVLLIAALPVEAFAVGAGGYRIPTISIVAYRAPADLEIQVEVVKKEEIVPADTLRTRRGWELHYRLYREDVFRSGSFKGNDWEFAGAVLLCTTGGQEFRVPIPKECLTSGGNRDVMTLDCASWTLRPGLPVWRGPVILAMRVLLVLGVKALVFLLMGYREWASWRWFLIGNLGIQIPLNLILNKMLWVNDTNWHGAVFLGSLFVLLLAALVLETLLLALLVREKDSNRTGLYIAVGDLAGAVALVLALSYLPV